MTFLLLYSTFFFLSKSVWEETSFWIIYFVSWQTFHLSVFFCLKSWFCWRSKCKGSLIPYLLFVIFGLLQHPTVFNQCASGTICKLLSSSTCWAAVFCFLLFFGPPPNRRRQGVCGKLSLLHHPDTQLGILAFTCIYALTNVISSAVPLLFCPEKVKCLQTSLCGESWSAESFASVVFYEQSSLVSLAMDLAET